MTDATTNGRIALLPDRGVVRVAGEDAGKLLQGLITNDMELLQRQPALYAALLNPQGKILFDFLVVKVPDGLLLETARDRAADLAKRLTIYKLRAKVVILDASDGYRLFAAWGAVSHLESIGMVAYQDPRLPELGARILVEARPAAELASSINGREATAEDYHAHRIALGVPEGGKDFAFGDTFPHEADLDQLNGVSFAKGCFVGQEVVSRMQNRATVRKRVVPVTGEAALATGAEITAGTAVIGTVGSVAGNEALALVRLDRAAEAMAKGEALLADGVAITLRKPRWATFDLAPAVAAGAP